MEGIEFFVWSIGWPLLITATTAAPPAPASPAAALPPAASPTARLWLAAERWTLL